MGLGCQKERDYVKHKVMGQDHSSSHFKLIMMAYPKKFDDQGLREGLSTNPLRILFASQRLIGMEQHVIKVYQEDI